MTVATLPVPGHIYSNRAMACLDCSALFDVGPDACPACTSTTFVPIETWFTKRMEATMTPDTARPAVTRTRSEITKTAGEIERLKARKRALMKKVEDTENQIREKKRFLSGLIEDTVPDPVAAARDGEPIA